MANFKKYTRYTNGLTTNNRKNKTFLILRKRLNLPEADNDTFVSITQDLIKRPDLISFKAYKTPELWWVIYEYNNIIDPLFDLQIGQIIKIPQLSRVLLAINKLGKV